jgi:hypothetical protein
MQLIRKVIDTGCNSSICFLDMAGEYQYQDTVMNQKNEYLSGTVKITWLQYFLTVNNLSIRMHFPVHPLTLTLPWATYWFHDGAWADVALAFFFPKLPKF